MPNFVMFGLTAIVESLGQEIGMKGWSYVRTWFVELFSPLTVLYTGNASRGYS